MTVYDYSLLYEKISQHSALTLNWLDALPKQTEAAIEQSNNGHLPKWKDILSQLPAFIPSFTALDQASVTFGVAEDIDDAQRTELKRLLEGLIPWRKGPYLLYGIDIDTEWRSDWKWDRLRSHISPLAGRTVLDVGCGNGYHGWRMQGEGAKLVVGIDPSLMFVTQYKAIAHFAPDVSNFVLPFGIEHLPAKMTAFDTVFSMGVLYHRRSPFDHLQQLREALVPGGELVLETLVVDGDKDTALVPSGRYGKMGNVWFIPSCLALEHWLDRCQFKNIRLVDTNVTSTEEQRRTEWMRFESLANFLDPEDSSKTIEGYPAPKRAIFVANS